MGLAEGCETKKAFFIGYMVHRCESGEVWDVSKGDGEVDGVLSARDGAIHFPFPPSTITTLSHDYVAPPPPSPLIPG